jgi:hypothetical protein
MGSHSLFKFCALRVWRPLPPLSFCLLRLSLERSTRGPFCEHWSNLDIDCEVALPNAPVQPAKVSCRGNDASGHTSDVLGTEVVR